MNNLCHHHYYRSAGRFFLSVRTKYSATSSNLAGGETFETIPKVVYSLSNTAMDHHHHHHHHNEEELDIGLDARVRFILSALKKAKLTPEFRGSEIVQLNSFRKATLEDIRGVHDFDDIDHLRKAVEDGKTRKLWYPFHMIEYEYVTATSYEHSMAAAGAGLSLVDYVVAASKNNANSPIGFALLPPPRHHILVDDFGGFCYFENAGIAARYAQRVHGLKRVLIIDFDVHFLRLTNDAFYDDPDIFVLSTHHSNKVCRGKFDETGSERGEGATLNLPLPDGFGDIGMRIVFDEVIVPCAQRFKPDLIIVSAGYDGHAADPEGTFQLTTETYYMLASGIKRLAEDLCGGRCMFFLEGGTSESIMSFSVAESFRAFLGEPSMAPEFEKKYAVFLHDEPANKIKQAIQRIKHLHSII